MKFAIITYGCRSNRCDSEWLTASMRAGGHILTERLKEADLIIISTCTVTATAAREARQAIRRARRKNPHGIIIAAGCAVQAEPAVFLSMPELDYTADMAARASIPEVAARLKSRNAPSPLEAEDEVPNPFPIPDENAPHDQTRARAVLKIQDGCDNSCTYCIVTRVRGDSRSLPTPEIMDQLKKLGHEGHGEVVLTGIHLGVWGRDLLPARNLADLVKVILRDKPVPRIRLSSIDPIEVSTGLMEMLASSDGLCSHLHLPLQSGDDEILEKMGRKYTTREAGVRMRLLRQSVPDMAIGLDIIVGFPGETDDHFQRTVKTLESLPFDYLHVFPFSPRPGTPAAEFPGKVPGKIIRERGSLLRELSTKRRDNFWRGQLGTVKKTLIESPLHSGKGWRGRTDNYIPVVIGRGDWEVGDILPVRLVAVEERRVLGEVSL